MKKRFIFILCSLFLCAGTIAATDYNALQQGAVGDGKTLNTKSLQSAIDALHAKGGGQLYFPAGRYLTGSLQLKSNVTLYLEKEAMLLGSTSPYDYPGFSTEKELKVNNDHFDQALIYAEGAENIGITGEGCIDGQGRELALTIDSLHHTGELVDKHYNTYRKRPNTRPKLLFMRNCRKVELRKTNFRSGAAWGLSFSLCADLTIDSLHVENRAYWNNDGIDISDCKDVRISNCFIESGDDCICLKNRREFEQYGSCEDVVVTNCTMTSRSCAVKIGSENMDKINNVLFTNCIIKDSNRGIGIQNRDEGTVTNVIFSNMIVDCRFFSDVWWGKAEPIYVTSYPRAVGNHKDAGWRFPKGAVKGACGEVSRIYFQNIKCTSENGIFVGGDTIDKVNRIYFDQVEVNLHKRTTFEGGIYDKRPCDGEGFLKGKTYGFFFHTASDIQMERCTVNWGDTRPDYAAENIHLENTAGIIQK